jgi:RHS repeat-associated protein
VGGSLAATYGYDKDGNRASLTRGNGVVTTYLYDSLSRLTDVNNSAGSSYHYTLRADGKRLAVRDASGTTSYTYDPDGHLASETFPGSGPSLTYLYDNVGNRVSRTVTGATGSLVNGTTSYTYDPDDRITGEAGPSGSVSHTYDYDGDETTVNGQAASYDWENRLTSLGSGTSYLYDADGDRVAATTSGTTTDYLVDTTVGFPSVVEEHSGSGSLLARYALGDDLLRMDRSGVASYYVEDGLGSTRALTSSAGAVTDTYTYDAYGEQVSGTGSTVNAFRFDAQQLDGGTGDYFLRARYYNEGNGRFLSQDPLLGSNDDPISLHRYVYANNDPVGVVDPSGEEGDEGEELTAVSLSQTIGGFISSAIFRVGALAASNATIFYAIQTANTLAAVYQASQDPDQGLLYLTTDGFAADFELLYTGGNALVRGIVTDTERLLTYDAEKGIGNTAVDWGKGTGRELRAAMVKAEIPTISVPNAAHHIVPGNVSNIPEVQRAQETLAGFGISANSAENGVYLPTSLDDVSEYGTPHIGSHNGDYYRFVGEYVSGATSKEDAIARLQTLGQLLQSGKIRLNIH